VEAWFADGVARVLLVVDFLGLFLGLVSRDSFSMMRNRGGGPLEGRKGSMTWNED
jgi:hypothetical protein